MKGELLKTLFFITSFIFPSQTICQNYLGYSKHYIVEAIKTERRDLKGPLVVTDQGVNYMIYSTKNDGRAIIYFFELMPVILDDGRQIETEICVKYYSKNKCLGYAKCPQMEEVIRSLDSHFEQGITYLQWIDYSKRNPQEWMLVRDDDYFEVM